MARMVLNGAGVRLIPEGGGLVVGVWEDTDGPRVRNALETLKLERLAVRYLNGRGVPLRYKVRA